MSLAEKLGKTLTEIRELPASEITLWVAYFKVKEDETKPKPESDLSGFKKMMRV